jgi:nucleotide-binding universal stress UspA family protein
MARLLGRGTAQRLLRTSPVPLLISRPELGVRSSKRILVLLDGSKEAETVLPEAVRVARKTGATIDIAEVEPRRSPGSRDSVPYLAEIAALLGCEEVPAEPYVFAGDVVREVLRHCREFGTDLIYMTDRRRGRWTSLVSESPAGRILRSAPCPVYVQPVLAGEGRDA